MTFWAPWRAVPPAANHVCTSRYLTCRIIGRRKQQCASQQKRAFTPSGIHHRDWPPQASVVDMSEEGFEPEPNKSFQINKFYTSKGSDTKKPVSPGDFHRLRKQRGGAPKAPHTPNEIRADLVRQLMRRVPHPVTVITAKMPHYDHPNGYRGMTVSSFNTVSLAPEIVVSFNVQRPSATYDAIKSSEKFCVHVLAATNKGAAIAAGFADGQGRQAFETAARLWGSGNALFKVNAAWIEDEPPPHRMNAPDVEDSAPPMLESNHVVFSMRCRTMKKKMVEIYDHAVVFGRVVSCRATKTTRLEWEKEKQTHGLLYVDRTYRRSGFVLDPLQANPVGSEGEQSSKLEEEEEEEEDEAEEQEEDAGVEGVGEYDDEGRRKRRNRLRQEKRRQQEAEASKTRGVSPSS